jgi:hypothetical protein
LPRSSATALGGSSAVTFYYGVCAAQLMQVSVPEVDEDDLSAQIVRRARLGIEPAGRPSKPGRWVSRTPKTLTSRHRPHRMSDGGDCSFRSAWRRHEVAPFERGHFRISRAARSTASGVAPQRERGLRILQSGAPNG